MSDPSKDFEDRNLATSEEAIEKALNYLRLHDPENANRNYAIGLLKRMQSAAKGIAAEDIIPELSDAIGDSKSNRPSSK